MTRDEWVKTTDDLRDMIVQRLNVRARSFPQAVRKAGRRLPAPARDAARELQKVGHRLDHPKLAARTDPAVANQAADTIRAALAQHRPGDRAARDRAFLMAEIGFRALIVIVAGLAFVQWQGLI